jgi:hypothetical protein
MAKAKQITVWVESTPGQIGRIARALAGAGVNITAFSATSVAGESPLRLQVSSPAKARKALQNLGVRISEEEVLRLTLPDKPGVLAEVGERLGNAGINVEYAFGTVAASEKKADVVLGVGDLEGATNALRGL